VTHTLLEAYPQAPAWRLDPDSGEILGWLDFGFERVVERKDDHEHDGSNMRSSTSERMKILLRGPTWSEGFQNKDISAVLIV
jgi:hypothetical protein